MHTAQEQFIAYVFHCEPSAGALSKTIEAACKVSCFLEECHYSVHHCVLHEV